jgi:hypothetical protein
MRATVAEQIFLLAVAGIVTYMCWNCRIAPSTIILIVVVGAFLFACTCPGMEAFAEVDGPTTIDYATLMDAGVVRPNVFNCANTIGNTAEESYMYADQKTDI